MGLHGLLEGQICLCLYDFHLIVGSPNPVMELTLSYVIKCGYVRVCRNRL
jgi:hypothetical protein